MAGILFEFLPQPCNVYVNGQLQKQCPAQPSSFHIPTADKFGAACSMFHPGTLEHMKRLKRMERVERMEHAFSRPRTAKRYDQMQNI